MLMLFCYKVVLIYRYIEKPEKSDCRFINTINHIGHGDGVFCLLKYGFC
ncbi:hypothetical protein HMPREF9441_01182 [Paraprevotella clara YIT 11840]|uniref:Uncharacterized protein n=1 Tax=Paraprevotella clara YIT 11840 TaxID=762968 RepID=G5SPA0_9BACT|nr:hypothetical protein HMPREF9441_01182 [Paraprevotella clara YIT 11840]